MARSANNLNAVLQDTADAIRSKTGSNGLIIPRDFADEIASIQVGITPTGSLAITSNGQYDITTYAQVNVSVPNPSTGTLNITSNGTYDVSTYASASVSVAARTDVYYPYIRNDDQQTRNPVNTVGSWVSALFISPNYEENAMNALTLVVLLNGIKYKVVSGGYMGRSDICKVEIYSTADDGVNWSMISSFAVVRGTYVVFGSCQIVSYSQDLWYNGKHYWTDSQPSS